MIIGVRTELGGHLYLDKEIYYRMETLKFDLQGFERFKKEHPNTEYTYEQVQESVERQDMFINTETGEKQEKTIIEIVDFVYVTRRVFSDEVLAQPPYNYTKVEIEDIYSDCEATDFNDDLTFNIEKYNARKLMEINTPRIAEITLRLEKLDQDFRQVDLGAIIPDIEERKAEFITLHNELRALLGKPPRNYTNS